MRPIIPGVERTAAHKERADMKMGTTFLLCLSCMFLCMSGHTARALFIFYLIPGKLRHHQDEQQ